MLPDVSVLYEIMIAVATAVIAIITVLTKTKKASTVITKQLEKNGGTSLIDKVDNIISTLKDMSDQLHRIEAWKTAWMELTEEPIFVTDKDGNYIWTNNAYSQVVGLTPQDLLGTGWNKIIVSKNKQEILESWQHCIETLTKFDTEFLITNQYTKENIPVRCVAKPLKDQNKLNIGYIGVIYILSKSEIMKREND